MAFLAVFAIALFLIPAAEAKPAFADLTFPLNAETGQPIPVTVNLTSAIPVNVDSVELVCYNNSDRRTTINQMSLVSGNATSGTWSFEIPAQEWKTQLNCRIVAEDISGSSSTMIFDIDVSGASPPKDIPWSLLIMVGFLAIALILTELAFKPGLYRPTGRQKAEKLEEEDRKRELEEQEKLNAVPASEPSPPGPGSQ